MERGACLFYCFEKGRKVVQLLKEIEQLFNCEDSDFKCFVYFRENKNSLQSLLINEIDELNIKPDCIIQMELLCSIDKLRSSNECISFSVSCLVDENNRIDKFGFCSSEIDLEPAFLQSSGVSRRIVDYVYYLTKKLFLLTKADFCVASSIEVGLSFEETCEHFILKYTKDGPQYLISALEEKREIIYSDLTLSPNQGYSKGSTIIHKKASECF